MEVIKPGQGAVEVSGFGKPHLVLTERPEFPM